MIITKRIFTPAVSLLIAAGSCFEMNAAEPVDYMPEIHGVVRGRYEIETHDGLSRFQVRNARLTVSGKVAAPISYFVQIDASDCGKMKFLDAYGRFDITRQTFIQAGQFRQPFGVDNFRAPGTYYFANRSFLGKTINNYRGTGAKAGWHPSSVPFTAEAGVFNASVITEQDVWLRHPSFACKLTYSPSNIMIATGYQTMRRNDARMNYADATLSWHHDGWLVEGEYMALVYGKSAAPTCHTWLVFANKSIPVKCGVFNRLSFQARYDGMTSYSNGIANANGELTITTPKRQRGTIGATLSYVYKKVHADVLLNYEKYWYQSGVSAPIGDNDKIVAELVVKF